MRATSHSGSWIQDLAATSGQTHSLGSFDLLAPGEMEVGKTVREKDKRLGPGDESIAWLGGKLGDNVGGSVKEGVGSVGTDDICGLWVGFTV